MWEVEYTDEFGAWWAGLDESVQEAVARSVELLPTPLRPSTAVMRPGLASMLMPYSACAAP